MQQRELWIRSSKDGSMQPSLFYKAAEEKRPLLVGLHTWSHDRFNQIETMLPYAERYGFNLLLPEFRGSNLVDNVNCRYACGSEYAKADVKDAVEHVIANEGVDEKNVFLLGLSGGGHMALLMAAHCPQLFKAVGAYVPICDLARWAEENADYRAHVLACCGGDAEEMMRRSPISFIDGIAQANVKIFHGKFDPVVSVAQSMDLYARTVEAHPTARVFLDIFDGGHEIDMETAMYWFLSQGAAKTAITG